MNSPQYSPIPVRSASGYILENLSFNRNVKYTYFRSLEPQLVTTAPSEDELNSGSVPNHVSTSDSVDSQHIILNLVSDIHKFYTFGNISCAGESDQSSAKCPGYRT